jgi:hypothetical protein
MASTGTPYWLIREPGKQHGCGSVDLDAAITSEAAVASFRDSLEPTMRGWLASVELEAELVVLTYVDDQPVVTPVR